MSQKTAETMIASLAKSTLTQYEKAIRLWWTYCREKGLSVYDANTTDVLEFFLSQLEIVGSYSTLNVSRAAISLIMGNRLGEVSEVSRFFRGVANEKSKKAKYSHTWDPEIVIEHISHWPPNEELPLKNLTKKLVTLLALATGQRVQTLAAIKLPNITECDNAISITITDKLKT